MELMWFHTYEPSPIWTYRYFHAGNWVPLSGTTILHDMFQCFVFSGLICKCSVMRTYCTIWKKNIKITLKRYHLNFHSYWIHFRFLSNAVEISLIKAFETGRGSLRVTLGASAGSWVKLAHLYPVYRKYSHLLHHAPLLCFLSLAPVMIICTNTPSVCLLLAEQI